MRDIFLKYSFFLTLFILFCYSELNSHAPWPTLRGNQQRTGKSQFSVSLNVDPVLKWRHSLDKGEGRWSTYVAIDENEQIYVCGLGEKIATYEFYAYNYTGKEIWNYQHKADYHNPGFCGNPIIGNDEDIFWIIPADSTFSFNSETGSVNWVRQGNNALYNVGPIIRGDSLYAFNYAAKLTDKTLRGLNTSTGVVNFNSSLYSPIGGLLAIDNTETLFISGCGYAIATTFEGSNYYRAGIPFGCISRLAINGSNNAAFGIANFVRTDFGTKVYALSFDGSIIWTYYLTFKTTVDGTSVGIHNGMVFASAPNILVALDQETGNLIWQYDIPNNSTSIVYDVSSPVIDNSGTVFTVVANSVSQQSSIWGFDYQTGTKIYESENFPCSTLDVGVALGIGSLDSLVVVCTDAIYYFSAN